METFEEAISRIVKDNQDLFNWIDKEYEQNFSQFFTIPEKLSKKLKSNTITDEELSEIMLNLPLDLIDVSEILSQYKVSNEAIKVSTKQFKLDLTSIKDKESEEYRELNSKILNNDLILNINVALVERVEKQITMCKELIMSAKKIWDARRKTEQVMPVKEQDEDDFKLPKYADELY